MSGVNHNTRDGELSDQSIIASRFWPKVEIGKPGECWIWQGRETNGYGGIQVNGERYYTHRLSYKFAHGEIPSEQVNHHCDTPLCVNPSHLYPGTHSDNMADAYERNESMREALEPHQGQDIEVKVGEQNPKSKLTLSDVVEIKKRLKNGERPSDISPDFDVVMGCISNIEHGYTWSHVDIETDG